jgi:hypothetical protein
MYILFFGENIVIIDVVNKQAVWHENMIYITGRNKENPYRFFQPLH